MQAIACGHNLIYFFNATFEFGVGDSFVPAMHDQGESRDHLVDISRWKSGLDGFWVFELVEVNSLLLVDANGVDSQIVVSITEDLFDFCILETDKSAKVPPRQKITPLGESPIGGDSPSLVLELLLEQWDQ